MTAAPPVPLPFDDRDTAAVRRGLPAGWRLEARACVTSTSDVARDAGEAGAAEGLVVWGGEQTGGRGRLGRSWASPPGNLYSSVLLRPAVPPARLGELTFVAALALADALAPLADLPPVTLKWPNDVLVGGAKIAGILLEGSPSRGGNDWLVIGTGVNIAHHPTDAGYPCTALAVATPAPPTPGALLVGYATALARRYRAWQANGFAEIRAAWLAQAAHLGDRLTARLSDRELSGTFCDLDADGHLILRLDDGSTRVVTAGDIFFAA